MSFNWHRIKKFETNNSNYVLSQNSFIEVPLLGKTADLRTSREFLNCFFKMLEILP